ncbi:unnamed protein product, partial [Phaeothamnion confervicola]
MTSWKWEGGTILRLEIQIEVPRRRIWGKVARKTFEKRLHCLGGQHTLSSSFHRKRGAFEKSTVRQPFRSNVFSSLRGHLLPLLHACWRGFLPIVCAQSRLLGDSSELSVLHGRRRINSRLERGGGRR